jgi:hypothetical protein
VTDIGVTCRREGADWRCDVELDQGGRRYAYAVGVRSGDLARLAPGAADPEDLVRRSFVFLLEREPPSSILGSFDLMVIARYFPEYESTVGASRA